jgi:CPA1 family monovalent cation:H+ antiporter
MEVAAIFLVITALAAYLNHRFIGLPTTIGVMAISLFLSCVPLMLNLLGYGAARAYANEWLGAIDFSEVLLQGMLSLLLFAGALHVDLSELRSFRLQVIVFALFGTAASTGVIGAALFWVLPLLGLELPLGYCLAFGALISPTDPIAVMGIIKSARAPKSLEVVIAGESLFNDGVGVVLFTLVAGTAAGGVVPSMTQAGVLLLREAGGGIVFGLILGYVTFRLLKSIDSYQEEVLITVAAVLGGYALASHWHVSGPLAMVVAGLMIGNHGRALAMSDVTRAHLDMFWELLDAILNCVLFVLIGMEVMRVDFSLALLLPAVLAILITLAARVAVVTIPLTLFEKAFALPRGAWRVLSWGGLRGGISVALALSLPPGSAREVVLVLTYSVVIFSVLVQGLTIAPVTRHALRG